jgi:hypothetical protein
MNWTRIAKDYPLAAKSFNSWLLAKSSVRGYAAALKGGTNILDLPFEMLMGVMLLYFNEQGLLFSTNTSMRGQLRIRFHRLSMEKGSYYVFGQGDQRMTIQHNLAWQEAFSKAFKEIERVCRKVDREEPPELVGADITAFDIDSAPDGPATETSDLRHV